MSERSRFRTAQKRRIVNLKAEVARLGEKASQKRALQSELPPKCGTWVKLNRDCQQLERRVESYKREIESTTETIKDVPVAEEEKLERPGHKTGGKRSKPTAE